jgi:hypothetical protein
MLCIMFRCGAARLADRHRNIKKRSHKLYARQGAGLYSASKCVIITGSEQGENTWLDLNN